MTIGPVTPFGKWEQVDPYNSLASQPSQKQVYSSVRTKALRQKGIEEDTIILTSDSYFSVEHTCQIRQIIFSYK